MLISILPLLSIIGLTGPAPAHPLHTHALGHHWAPTIITVVARDYTFEAPDTLPAGPATFRLENKGRVPHELVIFGAAPGQAPAVIRAGPTAEDRRNLSDAPIGVLFALPGQVGPAELTASLRTGRWYLIMCNFRDTKEMPFHFNMGMVDSIYVK
jgi:hypothetical protein